MAIKDLFKRKPNKFLSLLVRQTELTIQALDFLKIILRIVIGKWQNKLRQRKKKQMKCAVF